MAESPLASRGLGGCQLPQAAHSWNRSSGQEPSAEPEIADQVRDSASVVAVRSECHGVDLALSSASGNGPAASTTFKLSCQGCGEATGPVLACPTCCELGRISYFCSQSCFSRNWKSHSRLHAFLRNSRAAEALTALSREEQERQGQRPAKRPGASEEARDKNSSAPPSAVGDGTTSRDQSGWQNPLYNSGASSTAATYNSDRALTTFRQDAEPCRSDTTYRPSAVLDPFTDSGTYRTSSRVVQQVPSTSPAGGTAKDKVFSLVTKTQQGIESKNAEGRLHDEDSNLLSSTYLSPRICSAVPSRSPVISPPPSPVKSQRVSNSFEMLDSTVARRRDTTSNSAITTPALSPKGSKLTRPFVIVKEAPVRHHMKKLEDYFLEYNIANQEATTTSSDCAICSFSGETDSVSGTRNQSCGSGPFRLRELVNRLRPLHRLSQIRFRWRSKVLLIAIAVVAAFTLPWWQFFHVSQYPLQSVDPSHELSNWFAVNQRLPRKPRTKNHLSETTSVGIELAVDDNLLINDSFLAEARKSHGLEKSKPAATELSTPTIFGTGKVTAAVVLPP